MIKHVSPSGNDSNDGSSQGLAYKTLNHSISQLSVGDTLKVYDGIYNEKIINGFPPNSGIEYTTVETVGTDAHLVPPGGSDYAILFSQTGQQYIQFIGLNIDAGNTNYGAIKIEAWSGGNPHHIRFKDLVILGSIVPTGIGQGIICDGQIPNTIGYNEFINLNISRVSGDDFSHGIYIKSGNNLVDRCNIYDIPGACIHLYSTYPSDGNIIVRNRLHDIRPVGPGQRHWGLIITDNCPNTIALSNIIFNIPNEGVSSVGLLVSTNANGAKIGNNTITRCAGVGLQIDPTVSQAVGRNNIVFGNGMNLIPGNAAGSNNIQVDPLFTNVSMNDFTIGKNSPAYHAGIKINGWTQDALMNTYNNPPSCGAYEVVGTVEPPDDETVIIEGKSVNVVPSGQDKITVTVTK